MAKLSVRRIGALIVCLLAFARTSAAQESVPRIEAGGDLAVPQSAYGLTSKGLGIRFDLNLSRLLAIETRVVAFRDVGSRPVQFSAGIRATLVRARAASLYGFVLPGLYHHPQGLVAETVLSDATGDPSVVLVSVDPTSGIRTHFMLDMGAGIALFPASRTSMRIELARELHSFPALYRSVEQGALPTYIASDWMLHVGASYRFGPALQSTSTTYPRGWTIGPQLGVTVSTNAAAIPTVGMFASRRLGRFVDFDAGAGGFLTDRLVSSPWEGGRMMQALAGIKLGVREGRYGVFFKLRSGLNSYSAAARPLGPFAQLRRLTVPILDLGGVIEADVSLRLTFRVDVGETLSFSPGGPVVFPPELQQYVDPNTRYPAQQIYGLPIRFGLGWRF